MRRAFIFIALVPLLGACGASDKSKSTSVADAATKTIQAKSSRFTASVSFRGSGQNVRFGGGGIYDYQSNRGRMTIDMAPLARLSGKSVRDTKVELRFAGLVYYMKLPKGLEGAEGIPLGTWLKIDVARLDQRSGMNLGALQQSSQNPAQLLRFLSAAGENVTEVGEETVRGVATTRYRTIIDLERGAEVGAKIGDLSPEARQQLRSEIERLRKQSGVSDIPAEIWLDSDGLLRRMTM